MFSVSFSEQFLPQWRVEAAGARVLQTLLGLELIPGYRFPTYVQVPCSPQPQALNLKAPLWPVLSRGSCQYAHQHKQHLETFATERLIG